MDLDGVGLRRMERDTPVFSLVCCSVGSKVVREAAGLLALDSCSHVLHFASVDESFQFNISICFIALN